MGAAPHVHLVRLELDCAMTPCSTFRSLALAVIVAGFPPTSAVAQHTQPHSHAAPASRLGTVHMETSCAAPVRPTLDRGVALLHSFWFSAAIEAFREVLARDPQCVMAHWGTAMSWWGNPFASGRSPEGMAAGQRAVEAARISGAGTPREQGYVAAVAVLYTDAATVPVRTRVVAYEQAMDALAALHPDDVEARIFHALALAQSALPTDKTYANQLKAAAILEREFARQPEHPGLAHYLIHSLDVPALAPRALDAARRYAAIAPDAPHALHMPSHTFTRVGAWQESIDANLASAAAARKDNATAEELHALDYQAYAYLQVARDTSARRTVDALPALVPRIATTGAGNAAPPAAGFYAAAAIPARYALEREAWAEAVALRPARSPVAWADAVTHFARALGAARLGDVPTARAEVAQLETLRDAVAATGDSYWEGQVDIQRRVARAWMLQAEGHADAAVAAMREAAALEDATDKAAVTPGPIKPARELLGDLLLVLQRPAEALVEYEATLAREPRRFRATWGAATAAAAAGRRDEAARHAAMLLEIAAGADSPLRPELVAARQLVAR